MVACRTLTSLLSILLAWGAVGIPSTEARCGADPIASDRPAVPNAHITINPGCLQLEYSVLTSKNAGGWGLSFPTLLRVGAAEDIELRLEAGFAELSFPSSGDASASASYGAIGFKHTLGRTRSGELGAGLLANVSFTAGRELFETLSPTLVLIGDWVPIGWMTVSLNIGANVTAPDDDKKRRFALPWALSLTFAIGDLALFVDTSLTLTPSSDDVFVQTSGAGLAYIITKNIQVDAFFEGDLVRDERSYRIGVGSSVRF